MSKYVIVFGEGSSSSAHINNRKKFLVHIESSTQGLIDTTVKAELHNLLTIQYQELNLHYSGSNSFLYTHGTKVYHFEAKYSNKIPYLLCFGNI